MADERFSSWTEMPLHTVISEWLMKNLQIPSDWGTLVAYIGLFLITWYTIVLTIRLVVSVIWPLLMIVTAIVVLRIMQFYEPEEVTGMMTKLMNVMFTKIASALTKGLELILGYFN